MVNISEFKNLLKFYKEHNWLFEVDIETVQKDLKKPINDMRDIINIHKKHCKDIIRLFKRTHNMYGHRDPYYKEKDSFKDYHEIYQFIKKDYQALKNIKYLYDNQPASS
jgi:hypothetical protein